MRNRGRGAFLASMLLLVVVVGAQDSTATDPPEPGAVCEDQAPALAHHAGGALLAPQPGGAPVPCRSYTGFPGGESRIEVTEDNEVLFSPAPDLRGIASLGYGPETERTSPQWMFQNGGIAVSGDRGTTWALNKPMNATWTMDDAFSYYDRATKRYFWVALNSSPFPQVTEGGPGIREQGVLTESRILSTDDAGGHWQMGSAVGVIADRAPLVAARAPEGQPAPAGFSKVVYFCHVWGTDMGTCSKSMDGGLTWSVAGRSFGPGVHTECGGSAEDNGRPGWHALAPMPNGSIREVITCNGQAYLAESSDEGATWPIIGTLPHAGDLRSDSEGNLYLVELVDERQLMLSVLPAGADTWTTPLDVTAPGVDAVQDNWFYAVRDAGQLTFTYNGRRTDETTFDGFITATRSTLAQLGDASAVLWSAQVNGERPLMYGDDIQGVGYPINPLDENTARTPPPQTDQLGSAIGPDGTPWASFTEDCGPTPEDENCQMQNNQTKGLAAWFEWPNCRSAGKARDNLGLCRRTRS
jgi:hypothetical protein